MLYLELEREYAKFTGTRECVAVNTGTAALHVALEALELPVGSKVIVPEFTMYASALAVYYARLEPVFVDCDEDLLIDLEKVEALIDKDTKVIMVTHVYGRVVNMDKVIKLAEKYNLRVIEDACEAQGAYWGEKRVGSFDIGCFSFYRNKIIHGEEGGAITTNDLELAKKIRDMKSMSFGEEHNYFHKRIGFNYRITEAQSELILNSLRSYETNSKKREEIKNYYNLKFKDEYKMPDNRKVVWVYDLKHDKADQVVKRLKEKNIPARHSFKPMSMMPLFNEKENSSYKKTNSYKKSNNVFYLHVDPSSNVEKLEDIFKTVKGVMQEFEG